MSHLPAIPAHAPVPPPPAGSAARVPATAAERDLLRGLVREYVAGRRLVPPLSLAALRRHAEALIRQHALAPRVLDFLLVLLNNQCWYDELAAVPYQRRLLVLPACLGEGRCGSAASLGQAPCRTCSLPAIRQHAQRLGYTVVSADNPFSAAARAASGKYDALIGISCLSVLETVFPVVNAAGMPALAIPLVLDHCTHAPVDMDWVWEALELTSADRTRQFDLEAQRHEVASWFTPASLERLMGPVDSPTEAICRNWLAQDGKRWRPLLALCAYQALRPDPDAPVPHGLQQLAVAVECFHKASLVHDDIEDGDDIRYGEPTVHAVHGVPVAINVGDLILGHGYRLIGECDAPARQQVAMLQAAAAGHCTLCAGQGAELNWLRQPRPLELEQVLEIFRQKTAPAFSVALKLGALYAGADANTIALLAHFSEALGVAYQIRDDLDDFSGQSDSNDTCAMRPSLLLALAHARAAGDDRHLLGRLWRREVSFEAVATQVYSMYAKLEVESAARALLEEQREEASRLLGELEQPTLRGVLRRVTGRIFAGPPPAVVVAASGAAVA